MKQEINIGVKVKLPVKKCEDQNCPFHNNLRVRGNLFTGKITKVSSARTAQVEFSRLLFLTKYERYEKRKFGKLITVIYGINKKEIDLKELAKELKQKFACGGTVKGDTIELQGEHAEKTKEELTKLGFSSESIETN